ncbi:MAG: DUF2752 domain-containing protein [Clostridia bacterium]|nr:DUF2752 domain-containing protein [Clostridia bacterium]
MKQRLFYKQNVFRLCILLAVPAAVAAGAYGLRYVLLLPCPVKAHWHILCPGCGLTRAFAALLEMQIIKSVLLNPAALLLSAAGICLYIEQIGMFFGKRIKILPRGVKIYIILAAVFLLYCILRNIPAFSSISIA